MAKGTTGGDVALGIIKLGIWGLIIYAALTMFRSYMEAQKKGEDKASP